MTKKYVENEELVNPSRYTQNKIESWDFSLYSCFPHMIATVTEYVIRYKHKGGIQDLEKARIWLHKAGGSYKYIALCAPKLCVSEYLELAPEVNKENFADLSEEQLGIIRTAQTLTMGVFSKIVLRLLTSIWSCYLRVRKRVFDVSSFTSTYSWSYLLYAWLCSSFQFTCSERCFA